MEIITVITFLFLKSFVVFVCDNTTSFNLQITIPTSRFLLDSGVLKTISDCAGGDARVALNTLEHLLLAKLGCHHKSSASKHEDNGLCIISVEDIKEGNRYIVTFSNAASNYFNFFIFK